MKDITLKIVGKQFFDGQEESQLEFVTDGKLYVRKGTLYMTYDESEISGMMGCKTTLRVSGDTVKMKRSGLPGYDAEMLFEKGKRFTGTYDTPYGPMGIEILTNYVKNDMDMEELRGEIDIKYAVSLDGLAEGTNRLTIAVS